MAAQRVFLNRAVSHDRGRHIEDERRLAGWHGDGERIGAKKKIGAAPGRHVIGVGDRGIEPDHAAAAGISA